jgi:hypothetical protein
MKNTTVLLVHLLAGLAVLLKPGGIRCVLAENLLLKQQLLITRAASSTASRAKSNFLSVKITILTIEDPVAKALGEPERRTHHSDDFLTEGPTSRNRLILKLRPRQGLNWINVDSFFVGL